MASPFDPLPLGPEPDLTGAAKPVALVVDDDDQADAYRAAAPSSGSTYVVVKDASDVPSELGGMAILTERDLGDELRSALIHALGLPGGE